VRFGAVQASGEALLLCAGTGRCGLFGDVFHSDYIVQRRPIEKPDESV
jgi:hypothetical protein